MRGLSVSPKVMNAIQDALPDPPKRIEVMDQVWGSQRAKILEIVALKFMRMSNREVADALGMHESSISRIVNGDAYSMVLEQVRDKIVDNRGDITKRLEKEMEKNLEVLLAIRDNPMNSPNDRRQTVKDLNEWLRNPPTGRDRVKETVTLKMSHVPEPDVVQTEHEDMAPGHVIPLPGP